MSSDATEQRATELLNRGNVKWCESLDLLATAPLRLRKRRSNVRVELRRILCQYGPSLEDGNMVGATA